MDASEASVLEKRSFKILVGMVAMIALSPVAGMVLLLAVLPALPIALAVGAAIWPVNHVEDRREEAAMRGERSPPTPPAPMGARGTFAGGEALHA